MSAFTVAVKRIALATGLYRSARWLSTRVRPGQLQAVRNEVALYSSLLPANALCFDVGANIGDKSASLLATGAKAVIAFEPNPLVIPELRARCGHNPRWTMIEAAIGATEGKQIFYAHVAHGESSLVRDWGGQVSLETEVPVMTLDGAIGMWGVPDYVKIDVEGFELEVLSGLTQSVPVVSFEFHLNDAGVSRARSCLARLLELAPEATANVTPAEESRLVFRSWRPLQDFTRWFPDNLIDSLPGHRYGDIFVRTPHR